MPDMLVKLYDLHDVSAEREKLKDSGIDIRRALSPEKHTIINWVRHRFGEGWASECDVAFSNKPVSCFIAIENKKLVGFGCYDSTCKDFFGPTGVCESMRGLGIGKILLRACLQAMKEQGYAYAIIGNPGPIDFYAKTVNATIIEGSDPGIYRGMIE